MSYETNNYVNGGDAGQPGYDPEKNEWFRLNPFKLAEQWLPKQAKRTIRMVYAIVGLAASLFGIALLFWPGKTLKLLVLAMGIYFIISGLVRMVGAIVETGLPGGWRVLDILVGLVLAIGGIVMVKYNGLASAALLLVASMAIGIGWLMEGIMALVETWRLPSSGWAVFYGIVSIIAGLVMLCAPIGSAVWLVIFAGVVMLVVGISAIIRALRFGK
ncbi:HdeD family acid-resistance protein [Bifidobacterium bombi]|uniref:Integral membrane protein n=1 Tax=Bifidobacterium bombi DSM 19703 TaxID=1341695 RepID=A0A080N287_9BIFI|nr:DUF308 domain-containing protein [Bifidobacterium bombi]KFF31063.1 hypothetical protein BBOMB_0394 [Bifidobacterium bombi DSM 19703]